METARKKLGGDDGGKCIFLLKWKIEQIPRNRQFSLVEFVNEYKKFLLGQTTETELEEHMDTLTDATSTLTSKLFHIPWIPFNFLASQAYVKRYWENVKNIKMKSFV